MISSELKNNILIKISQGESIEELSSTYSIPIALLNEWTCSPPDVSNEHLIISYLSEALEENEDLSTAKIKEKLNQVSMALLKTLLHTSLDDPFVAKALNLTADTLLKIKTVTLSKEDDSSGITKDVAKFRSLLKQ